MGLIYDGVCVIAGPRRALKLSSGAGQPTITLRTFLDGTDDGGGISESSGVSEEPAAPRSQTSSTLKELPQQLPSCSARAAVYIATYRPGVASATP
jgi:hypothetical protein